MSIKREIERQEKQQIVRAIKWAGGASVLALLLGVSPQVVSNWRQRGRISATGAAELEKVSKGEFKKSEMRPDVKEWYL